MTVIDNTGAAGQPLTLPARDMKRSTMNLLGWVVILAVLAWAWEGSEMNPLALVEYSDNMAEFASGFFPPNFHEWPTMLNEMLITVQVAIWGTVLAVICSVPLGILSSQNLVPWWVYQPTRRLMDAARAINEFVFAMLFVVAVGLGPFAGVLALWIHTTGVLAKLFSEAVEAIDPNPVEGIRATGADAIHEVIFGAHSAGTAAVDFLFALPVRKQSAFGDGHRHCRGRRHRHGAVGIHPWVLLCGNCGGHDHHHRDRDGPGLVFANLASTFHLIDLHQFVREYPLGRSGLIGYGFGVAPGGDARGADPRVYSSKEKKQCRRIKERARKLPPRPRRR